MLRNLYALFNTPTPNVDIECLKFILMNAVISKLLSVALSSARSYP